MSIVTSTRPMPASLEHDRPPAMSGLVFGLLLALPLWAAILAFLL